MLLFAFDRDGVFTFLDGGLLAELVRAARRPCRAQLVRHPRGLPELLELGRRLLGGERLEFASVALDATTTSRSGASRCEARPARETELQGIIVDISARVAAERSVLDATRREMALVEHASDVIFVMTQDGLLLSANPAAHRLLGPAWSDGEALHIEALVHPARSRPRATPLRRGGRARQAAHRQSSTGSRTRMEPGAPSSRSRNNMIDDPAVNGFIVTLRDVTTRRESEERLASNAARQAALADLGRWALVGLAYPDLVEDAVTLLAEQLEVDFVHVFEAMPDAAFVTLTASRGHSPAGPELLSTDPTSSPVSFALVTQETVICDDLAREARFEMPDLWTRSEAMSVIEVPIPGQDSPAGVLGVGCRSPRRFADEDVNFVVAVANVLAAAAARSRAEGAIRDQALHDPLTGLPNRLVLAEHGHTIAAPKPVGDERRQAHRARARHRPLQGDKRHPGTRRR